MSNTIEPGTYTARATRWHWDTAQSGGMSLAFMLRIEEGPHAGRELRGTLYFDTDRVVNGKTSADRSIEALRSMGLQGGIDTIDENAGGLDAGQVSIKVEINDKNIPFAKFINPFVAFTAYKPPAENDKRAFFAQMNARLKGAEASARAAGTSRPAPTRAPAGPPRGFAQEAAEDDVPF